MKVLFAALAFLCFLAGFVVASVEVSGGSIHQAIFAYLGFIALGAMLWVLALVVP